MVFENKPIPPLPEIIGWESILINACNEKLIPLSKLDYNRIIVKAQYYLKGISGATTECYARESVGELLLSASKNLPIGYKFVIWDAWRSLKVQQILFDEYLIKLKEEYSNLSKNKLLEYAKKYVSIPSENKKNPSPHSTGGAIDLTIQNSKGNYLEMGTVFDEFCSRACTRYYEKKEENGETLKYYEGKYRRNRRLLYFLLTEVGFTNYPLEWWHFDYGNQFWGKLTNKEAIYTRIDF